MHCAACLCSTAYLGKDELGDLNTPYSPELVAQFQELQSEFERLQNTLFDLRRKHNATRPVNRLPREILSTILAYSHTDRGGRPLAAEWSSVSTQVCSLWRNVGLQTPDLWKCLDLNRPKLALALCKRFPRQTFWVPHRGFLITPEESETLIETILLYPSRIKRLRLTASATTIVKALENFQQYAPVLTWLSLRSTDKGDDSIMNTLQALHMPSLQGLLLRYSDPVIYKSSWLRSRNLRFLKLESRDASAPGLKALLKMLRSLQSLNRLDLICCLPEESIPSIPFGSSEDAIHLQSLRYLSIEATAAACITLVRHLRLSPSSELHLACSEGGNDAAKEILHVVRPYCTPPVVEVAINLGELTIRFNENESARGSTGHSHPVSICILDEYPERFLHATALQLSEMRLTELNIFVESEIISDMNWHDIFGDWPGIKHLGLQCESTAMSVLQAIRPTDMASGAGSALPDLVSLAIAEADATYDNTYSWFGLCRAEVTRRSAGLGLRSLKLDKCYGLEKTEVLRLRDIVPKLILGENEYRTDELEDDSFLEGM